MSPDSPGVLLLMPKVGQSMEEGVVVEWHLAEGEHVAQGQVIVTIETDKATYELEAPASGPLHILVPQGDEVSVETPIAVIGSVDVAGKTAPPVASDAAPSRQETDAAADSMPVLASPRAKRLAAEHGIDLHSVASDAKDGVITAAAVERAIAARQSQEARSQAWLEKPSGRPVRERRKLTGIKRATARRTQEAWQTIPHIVQMVTVDASGLLDERRRLEGSHADAPPSINELLVYLAAQVMTRHPELNGTIEGDDLILFETVDVGFAVDTPRGLLVPVVRDAGGMSLAELVASARRLIAAARGSGLGPDEVGRASLTVSNLGMFGIRAGTPVINLGEPVLVFVGAIEERPAVKDGRIVARPQLDLSVAYDHRVANGVQAAAFTRDLVESVESLAPDSAPGETPGSQLDLAKRELASSSPGDSYQVSVDLGQGRRLLLDEPAVEGGTDQGPTPVDAFLAGLLGCLTISFKAAARRRKVPIERIDGRVKSNEGGHIKQIHLVLEVWSPAPEEQVRALLERAERGCYVSALLKPDLDYQLELVVHRG